MLFVFSLVLNLFIDRMDTTNPHLGGHPGRIMLITFSKLDTITVHGRPVPGFGQLVGRKTSALGGHSVLPSSDTPG